MNAARFAAAGLSVVGVEWSGERVELVRQNLLLWQSGASVDVRCGDFVALAEGGEIEGADVVFVAPPWGGPGYARADGAFDPSSLSLCAADGYLHSWERILGAARRVASRAMLFVPFSTNEPQLRDTIRAAWGKDAVVEIVEYRLITRPRPVAMLACINLGHPEPVDEGEET
jgi:trimethylguanosine synthase